MQTKQDILRRLPSVDEMLRDPSVAPLLERYPRDLVVNGVRSVLEAVRSEVISAETEAALPGRDEMARRMTGNVERSARPNLQRVINGTGVVVHTNLGRSLLAERAIERMVEVSRGYSNLEFDLDRGERGSRYSHVEGILRELTGAESALVVNNNAAAVYLSLGTLAVGREVIVSRGQLVEIGGSFRIPDVMARSGAKLVEVGATNKTHLRDYRAAVTEQTGLLLKVHTSNYQIVGFTSEVPLEEMVTLGRELNVPVMEDLGSGCFMDLSRFGLRKEPTVQETVKTGVDICTFSGDKLLGGPQAGIVLGRKSYVDLIKKNPVNRAFRIDKLTLAALEATLMLYRNDDDALREIPTLSMICADQKTLSTRAQRLAARLRKVASGRYDTDVTDGVSRVGGGALPTQDLPTRLVAITPHTMSSSRMEKLLRKSDPPLVCRIEHDRVLLDVRTITEAELPLVQRSFEFLAG